MRSWSWRRRLLVGGGVVAVAWVALVGLVLLDARAAARDGADELRSLQREVDIEQLGAPETAARLAAAAGDLERAEGALAHPVLWPLRVVPVAARHLGAVQQAVGAGREATEVAQRSAAEVGELVDRPGRTGPDRLALLADLSAVASDAEAALAAIDPGRPDGLVGVVGDAVAEIEDQRARAEVAAGRLDAASTAIAGLLRGPEPYLLLGANNAEMRNGSGMFLSAAELAFADGRLELGEVQPTAELVLPEGQVPVRGDLADNWPWLDSGRDLRTLGLTADFPQSAAIAARHRQEVVAREGGPGGVVAGVISVDVDALRGLLRAVGPVEVESTTYTADTVRGLLLRDQYRDFADDRDERRDRVGEVARAVFERVEDGDWELDVLAGELVRAVAGRHLLVWSADEATQAVWEDVGVAGSLGPESLAVSLLNRSATKLDSWIETSAEVAFDDQHGIELRYRIANTAPAEGPPYLIGPNVEGLSAGDHVGLVVANLPAGTTEVEVEGAEVFLLGGDGPTVVVGGEVEVPRGEEVTVVVRARLDADLDHLRVEPTARIPRTSWTIGGQDLLVDRPRGISL